jgi:hypothetical protein
MHDKHIGDLVSQSPKNAPCEFARSTLKPFQRPYWDAARRLHDTRLEPTDVSRRGLHQRNFPLSSAFPP